MTSSLSLAEFADQVETVFDEAVEQGNDDQLFAAGYLRGHFDLVVAQLLLDGVNSPEALWSALDHSLNANREELNPQDRAHVEEMLQQLKMRGETI